MGGKSRFQVKFRLIGCDLNSLGVRPLLSINENTNENIFIVVILYFLLTGPYEQMTTTKIISQKLGNILGFL